MYISRCSQLEPPWSLEWQTYRKPCNLASNTTAHPYTCMRSTACTSTLTTSGKFLHPRSNRTASIMGTSSVSASRRHPTRYMGSSSALMTCSTGAL